MSDTDGLTPLVEIQRKQNRITLIVGAVIAFFGGLLWLLPAAKTSDLIIKIVIVGFFAVFGLALVFLGLRSPHKADVIRALSESPDQIVWIYVQKGLRAGRPVRADLKLGLITGKLVQMAVGIDKDDAMLALVASRLPHATTGWTRDRETQFHLDPGSLRRG